MEGFVSDFELIKGQNGYVGPTGATRGEFSCKNDHVLLIYKITKPPSQGERTA